MQDLIKFMREKGFDFEPTLTEKNQFQSFKTPTRKGWFAGSIIRTKSGKEVIVANFGDWRTGEKFTYITPGEHGADQSEIERKIKAQQKAELEARDRQRDQTAQMAQDEWGQITDSGLPSPYLAKKKIPKAFDCRTHKTSFGTVDLIVPMRDATGKLWGYQQIQEDGEKSFLPGQRTQGLFHLIGSINPEDLLYITEGFATGATIHMATNKPVACAFFANNLLEVGKAIREKYPDLTLVIAGDDDKFSDAGNAGKEKAIEAAQQISATCVFPKFKKLDTKPTDFNDLLILEGLAQVSTQISQHEPIPPSQFIKTEFSGFHSEKVVRGLTILTPEYEDLRRYFDRIHKYKVMSPSGICYIWNGKHYEQFDKKKLENFAHVHFRPIADNKKISEFVGLVLRSNVKPYEWFETETLRKINFQNGYLDLGSGEFKAHTPDIGFRHVLDYDYDPKAECPNFNKMLEAVTVKDESLQKVILEFAGYAISQDSCWAQKALVLEGLGSNGKSTLINVLTALAGPANVTSLTLGDIKGEYYRQTLDGKLLNIAEETPSRALADSSIFKNLVTGGSTMVRKIYKDPYMMKNRAKLIFSCNTLPATEDTTDALFRRLIIIPFMAKFEPGSPDFDPHIEEKMMKELSGIFNRVLAAYRELWDKKQFTDSAAAREALDQYARDINPIRDWLDEKVEVFPLGNGHDELYVTFHQLYDEYRGDMERQGFRPLNAKAFGHELRKAWKDYIHRRQKRKVDARTQQVVRAVKLHTAKSH